MAHEETLARFRSATPLQRVQIIANGFPAAAVREIVSDPHITLSDLVGIVGPRRTLQRRLERDEALATDESDRLARFLRVLDLATVVFGNRASAMKWLTSPKRRLVGERPLELLKTDAGSRLVEEILDQARHGFAA